MEFESSLMQLLESSKNQILRSLIIHAYTEGSVFESENSFIELNSSLFE